MAKQERALNGAVVAITGGAQGIGRATAAALIREGARVSLGDIDVDSAERTATELGNGVVAFPLDVSNRESFAAFLDRTEDALGPLDILVNNAGIMLLAPFVDEDDARTACQLEVNVWGVIHGMRLALPGMLERRSGHIVNVASAMGKIATAGGASYSASKYAVVGLSEAVRRELVDTPVELSLVMPGLVNTALAGGVPTTRGARQLQPEDVAAAIVDALKHPRFAVYVPRWIGPLLALMGALPRRATDAVWTLLRSDHVLLGADRLSRAAYEERATVGRRQLDPPGTERVPQ